MIECFVFISKIKTTANVFTLNFAKPRGALYGENNGLRCEKGRSISVSAVASSRNRSVQTPLPWEERLWYLKLMQIFRK
jgi:hypothetical protein